LHVTHEYVFPLTSITELVLQSQAPFVAFQTIEAMRHVHLFVPFLDLAYINSLHVTHLANMVLGKSKAELLSQPHMPDIQMKVDRQLQDDELLVVESEYRIVEHRVHTFFEFKKALSGEHIHELPLSL